VGNITIYTSKSSSEVVIIITTPLKLSTIIISLRKKDLLFWLQNCNCWHGFMGWY